MFPGREAEHRLVIFQTIGHGVEEGKLLVCILGYGREMWSKVDADGTIFQILKDEQNVEEVEAVKNLCFSSAGEGNERYLGAVKNP